MSRRYSRSDKEKWSAAAPPPPPHTRRAPIRIPDSDPAALIAENKLTIIGRVTNPRFQRPRAVIDFLPQVWNLEGHVEGRELGLDKFQFRFDSEHELQTVLDKGPYHYKRWMLILQRWEPVVSENFPSQISFWVKIHGIPLHYWNEKAVETISDALGHVSSRNAKEAKFRVEVNGLLPLEMKMEILLPSEEVTEVEFQYLKIEKHCFTCFSLLHEEEDCPSRPRGARAPKDRPLGITQAIALQRIEADKKRHDDKRGYRRPAPQQSGPNIPSLTNREEHRHYSDNRDSHLLPSDPASHRDYHRHYSENRGSRSLHVNPASHHSNRPNGGSFEPRSQHDETVRTPAASATRGSIRRGSRGSIADGQIIYPVNQNNSGGQSNSRERIPTRDRLSGQSQEYRVPAMERLSGGDTSMVPVIELQDNGGEVAVEPALQPSHLASGSRVPASLRLGSPSVSGNRNKAKVTAAATLSKHAGKRKVSKTTSNKRVARSPMQVLSLSKSIAARSKNPPRRRLCPARYANEFAGPGSSRKRQDSSNPITVNIPSTNKEGADFRSHLPPLP